MLHNYAYPTKLRVGCIGAGRHAYRNILPCFRYLPVDLVALADHDRDQGIATASLFGAKRFYPNHKALLAKETTLDALIIVVGPDPEGRPSYPELAADALRAGFHVWIESPPCASKDDVKTLTNACMRGRKFLQTNLNGMFMPAYLKAAAIMEDEGFGSASSFAMRYPATLTREALTKPCEDPRSLLGLVRPYATVMRLFGEARGLTYMVNEHSGDAIITLAYASGLIGTLHLCGSQARRGPRERLEIIGEGAHVVVENASRVTYYRSASSKADPDLLDATDYYGPAPDAPVMWEPQLSDPAPYNQHLVMQGYLGSLEHFTTHLLRGKPPRHGNVVDLLHMMLVLDKIQEGPQRTWLSLY
ncbi:MAG: Gfo/Idh/MocA family oxidoreductase [Anaerolineae bacterium]|nr:Gfo/Idh/MocA family oxidoreductase [Anaerolineae bacterium]